MGEGEFSKLLDWYIHIHDKSQTKFPHFLQNLFLFALAWIYPLFLLSSPSMLSLVFAYVFPLVEKKRSSFIACTSYSSATVCGCMCVCVISHDSHIHHDHQSELTSSLFCSLCKLFVLWSWDCAYTSVSHTRLCAPWDQFLCLTYILFLGLCTVPNTQ